MDDNLDPVTQEFIADVTEYVGEVERAAGEARKFAGSAEEAKVAVDGMRDKVTEAAAALKITRDEMGKLRNASGEVITATEAQSMALKHLRDRALEAAWAQRELADAEKKGLLSRIGGSIGGLFGGGGGGGGSGGLPGPLGAIPLAGANPEALLAIIPAIMAVLTEVGALTTGLVAAGAGAGAFAALAAPAFGKVHSAYTQIQADQHAYDRALTSKARATAMAHLKQDWASLDPAQAGAVRGVQQLTGEFHKLSTAFEPTAFKVFNEGLQVANQFLPYIGQFANAAAPAIEHLVSGLGRFVGGGEFKYFMGFLQSLAGPVLTAVGSGMKGLGERVMMLMETFSKKDVINSVNIAFRILGFTVQLVQGLIMEGMDAWDLLTSGMHNSAAYFDEARHWVASLGHDIAHYFDDARHAVAAFAHGVAHDFDDVRHGVAEVGHFFAAGFDLVRHDLAATADWIGSHWKIILAWLVAPIGMAVYEIRTHTHQIAQAFDALRHDVAAILAGARHDVAAFADWVPHAIRVAFDTVRHDTAAAMAWLRHEIAHAFDVVRHNVAAATGAVRHDVAAAWDWLRHETAHLIDNVVGYFRALPGRTLAQLAALPGEMLRVGENVIKGLINGIKNAAAAIPGIMKGLASDVASYFTNPLKLFSPSRVFFEHGVNIVLGAINGVRSMAPQLQAAMHQLGSGVATGGIPGVTAGAGGPGGGGRVNVTVPLTAVFGAATGFLNDPHFLQYIQQVIQEAVLRYNVNNPGNGLAIATGGRGL